MTEDTRTDGQVGHHGTAVVNGPEDDVTSTGCRSTGTDVEDDVRRLRQRIFTASRAGDLKKVRNLQKLMLRSRANALVSVRRVTERNAGRKTAGVDGTVVVTAPGKAVLADSVQTPWRLVDAQARQAGVHNQGQREEAPARHTGDRRQGAASPGRQRTGTRVGGTVRAEVLWLPAGPWLPRRHLVHLLHRERQVRPPVLGARRGPGGGIRPDRPLPPARRNSARSPPGDWSSAG